jgi:alkanesulfonate monooxygenase SsuD/methylene tetrahydromethanopterin reductase-like flavin-dependent oxidoreductase (luciferase family)
MVAIRLILDLSVNATLVDPRDIPGLVDLAVEAERVGFDGCMVSEHVVMGDGADANGLPLNPREFVMPVGARTFVVEPSQFVDDVASFPEFGRQVVAGANEIAQGMP